MSEPLATLFTRGETLKIVLETMTRDVPPEYRRAKNIGFSYFAQHNKSIIDVTKLGNEYQLVAGDYKVWTSAGKFSIELIDDRFSSLSIIRYQETTSPTSKIIHYSTRGMGISLEEFDEVVNEIYKSVGLMW